MITSNKASGANYLGNTNLKGANVPIDWSPEMISEWIKCKNDPIYFAQNYIKIVHVDRGLITIDLYDYQQEIIEKFNSGRRLTVVTSRQAGKCVCINTPITLKNKKTGKIITMSIGEFYEMQKIDFKNDDNKKEM